MREKIRQSHQRHVRRGRLLAVASVALSTALLGFAAPTQGAPALATVRPVAQPVPSCSYPPVRTPTLTLVSSVSGVKPATRFTLSGKLTVNSCGLKNWPVGLFTSTSAGGPFTLVNATITNPKGEYSFETTQAVTRWYRTASAAGDGYNAALSNVVTVTKK